MKTAQMAAQKWAQNMQNAGAAITAGVQAVTVAPGQLAAAQQQAYLQGVQNSVHTWAQNVAAVSLPAWQKAMTTKGIQNLAAGIPGGQAKQLASAQKWFPIIQNITQSLPARGPAGTNQARMIQFSNQMHQAKGGM